MAYVRPLLTYNGGLPLQNSTVSSSQLSPGNQHLCLGYSIASTFLCLAYVVQSYCERQDFLFFVLFLIFTYGVM